MASIDVEKLLTEISEDLPCGPNLEYEPEFQELERSTQFRAEQRIGDAIVEGFEPNWGDVFNIATELFSKTKDLRIAVFLTRSSLHKNGFPGLSEGLKLICRLLEKYWDHIHPQLDPDDNNDPTFRVNTIAGLADAETVLKSVKTTPIVTARGIGHFSIRDIDIAKGLLQPASPDESTAELGVIDAAFMQAEISELQATVDAVKQAREDLATIEKIFTEKVTAAQSPNLSELNKILHHIGNELGEQLGRRGISDAEQQGETAGEEGTGVTGGVKTSVSVSGEIRTRDDVIRVLDKICDFYKQNEPSHPLPILLQRAKRLVRKDFTEILKDIAPDALKQLELIKGKDE
jgi:type VI secretion system protein ImpA